jgi:hypothetical protein
MTDEKTKHNLEEQFPRKMETKTNITSFSDFWEKNLYGALYNACTAIKDFNANFSESCLQKIHEYMPEQYNGPKSLQLLINKSIEVEQENINFIKRVRNAEPNTAAPIKLSLTMSELLYKIAVQYRKSNDLKIAAEPRAYKNSHANLT